MALEPNSCGDAKHGISAWSFFGPSSFPFCFLTLITWPTCAMHLFELEYNDGFCPFWIYACISSHNLKGGKKMGQMFGLYLLSMVTLQSRAVSTFHLVGIECHPVGVESVQEVWYVHIGVPVNKFQKSQEQSLLRGETSCGSGTPRCFNWNICALVPGDLLGVLELCGLKRPSTSFGEALRGVTASIWVPFTAMFFRSFGGLGYCCVAARGWPRFTTQESTPLDPAE